MLHLKTTIAGFLMYARQLIFGVRDDAPIRERILKYNFDAKRLQFRGPHLAVQHLLNKRR